MKGVERIACNSHGTKPWEGHVICDACRRLYQTKDPDGTRYAPAWCECKKPLMPSATLNDDFTARPVCVDCFKSQTEVVS